MKNCIRCKKEKKKKKKGSVWYQWFETTYFKIQLKKKKKKKNLRIAYQTAIFFKKLDKMDTRLEKTLKKEIIWCVWNRGLHTPNGIVRISKRFEYPCLKKKRKKEKGT